MNLKYIKFLKKIVLVFFLIGFTFVLIDSYLKIFESEKLGILGLGLLLSFVSIIIFIVVKVFEIRNSKKSK